MRRLTAGVVAAAIAVTCCLAGAGTAAAGDVAWLAPAGLGAEGGSSWQPEPAFRLAWRRPGAGPESPLPTLVDFVVRDQAGNAVVPLTQRPWHDDSIAPLTLPAVPGTYVAEVWLEAAPSLQGPHATTVLRFDNTRPGPPRAAASASWFGAGSTPSLRIDGTEGPLPPSGVQGYAVSVDRGAPSSPCALAGRCQGAEIDLPAGQAPGEVGLGALPEGVNVVRVASVSGSGVPSASAALDVRVDLTPPAVVLAGLPAGWARGPVRVTATAHDPLSGMAPSGSTGPVTAIAVDGGATVLAKGDEASTAVSGEGAHLVSYSARDAAGNTSDAAPGSPASALVRIDETPPAVSFSRAQDPAEPERIEATVSDPLSGPDTGRGSIAVRAAGSAAAFQPLPTTIAGERLKAVWDSDAFPPGSYEFRATGYDLAGNSATGERRGDGARMVLANPLKRPTDLQFGFGARRLVRQRCARVGEGRRCHRQVIDDLEARPATLSAGYGHGVSVTGQLETTTGAPLAAMPVEIVETFDAGASTRVRTTTARTGEDGRFRARLLPGPNRRIEAFFGGTRVLSRCGGRELRLGVPGSVRLRASSAQATIGGRPVLFSGRIGDLGASPAAGRPVELQFRVPGAPWSEFRTVRTDARGRFRYSYAFADDDSRGVRFQFRAVAPAEEGWPYETGISRPVLVTGR